MHVDKNTQTLISLALKEDLNNAGDLSTRFFLPPSAQYSARLVFKEPGVLCGRHIVDAVFRRVCPRARITWKARDGQRIKRGAIAARILGPRAILTAERTALNFLQKLSGIATLTRAYAEAVQGTRSRIYDTRKTLPAWRALSKYAVNIGGGVNHRMGLYDMVMLKDNHLDGVSLEKIRAQIASFRKRHPRINIEIETRTHTEVQKALSLTADILMLDNMPPAKLAQEIRFIRKNSPKTKIEISGGVTLKSMRRLARLGADRISIGRITHSAPALDISMKLDLK